TADAIGSMIVTTASDKTARVWDGRTGELVRVLRGPIAPGDEGQVAYTAMAPDGSFVAVGGITGRTFLGKTAIYLYDPRRGDLLRALRIPIGWAVISTALTSDARRLAVGTEQGVCVFTLSSSGDPWCDREYGSSVYGVAFAPDGSLAVSAHDGKIRLYSPALV